MDVTTAVSAGGDAASGGAAVLAPLVVLLLLVLEGLSAPPLPRAHSLSCYRELRTSSVRSSSVSASK
jgi:hypothetical protein